VAETLAPGTSPIPKPAVETVIHALPADDVTRLIDLAARCAPDRWPTLVDEVGEELAREPLLVGIATAAIAELVPPPPWLVVMREATADTAPGPLNVLASLLHPESVWSISATLAAHARMSGLPLVRALRAVISFGQTEMTDWHLDRARWVARSVEPILPMSEAPRTSEQLAEAIALLSRRAAVAELCELLLITAVLKHDGVVTLAPSLN
jgi:hypothetical protein